MSNLVCFKHPKYEASKSPQLSCKICCGLFLAHLKEQNAAKKLAEKSQVDVCDGG